MGEDADATANDDDDMDSSTPQMPGAGQSITQPSAPLRPGLAANAAAAAAADASRLVARVRRRHGGELGLLAPGLPSFDSITEAVLALQAQGRTLPSALRVTRQLVMERLAVLDIEAGASMEAVTGAVTALAEAALELALAAARAELDGRWGVLRNAAGEVVDFWILGMGKLGARELNVSSDIDLIYVYDDDGQTDGRKQVSAQEYMAALAKRLYALIGDTTEDGFVFRVDLALRPNGNSGPVAVNLAMLEEYFLVQGREWERFAWLKSRVLVPRASVAAGRPKPLRALVTHFVYRRYLDYGVFQGLRQLHAKVRDEAERRAAGRPDRANDVKLGRGGIREIEFIVQLLQVVRGGQFPEIRTRATRSALAKLAAAGLMSADTAAQLDAAYVFLRRVEHRIQFLDDRQTHQLPTDPADLAWIAASLGQDLPEPTPAALAARLAHWRERVATEFDALLHEGREPAEHGQASGRALDDAALAEALPEPLAARVREWAAQPRVQALRDEAKLRLGAVMQRAGRALAEGRCDETAALRFVDWLEPLLRRDSHLALLAERPEVVDSLLALLGLARWPMRYLMRHPGVIDELADRRLAHERFDRAAFEAELEARHDAWERAGQADEESLLDTLRHAHHAEVFRTLVRDVHRRITVEQVADDLSALADAIVALALRWAWARLKQRHREQPRFAVIAYGKLGGKELGYGGDLDVVFLYEDADEPDPDRAQEVYGHFVRKLITWLTLRTGAGELFDIDTALRPNGGSGLLVTSMDAFERYQLGRGGNTAWTWEHQAITRARFCAGDAALGQRFESVRRAVLAAPRDAAALRREIVEMRERVRQAHPVRAGGFDIKQSSGGMMDAEFAVQHLVLAHAGRHPPLQDNVGNIALLRRADDLGLLADGIGHRAADAYRELRRAQHKARLDEQPTQVEPAQLAAQAQAIAALWRAVLG